MSFADKLKKVVDEAPSAGFVNVNFGKLTTTVNVLEWKETDEIVFVNGKEQKKRVPVRVPFTEDMKLTKGQDIELTFNIKISELNPKLEFDYERNVVVKKSSDDGKFKTDWTETVLPSLEKVFGADWATVITNKKGVYVAAEHVDSVAPAKEGKKNYGVPKFTAKFKSLDECKAARDERYGHKSEDEETVLGVPQSVIDQAKALLKSLGGNQKQFEKMLKGNPFGEYEPEAILAEME